ncbi:hypothetical protein L249_5024 [Ophiocordyceps polyrhachis-furcata BCC 54312]|uniref:Uncharacterized protein n=1 Tax=Ophiocordyceps polyrhachis-furcata BCC 54312 TaxID=1330021 RepID=A0A367L3W9_9HYPO|nr:hypothetical protein L249_5024 [Ophiocordyceps polyrhachis-furcata BCC 54312]
MQKEKKSQNSKDEKPSTAPQQKHLTEPVQLNDVSRPRSQKPDNSPVLAAPLPDVKHKLLLQPVDQAQGQDGKHLVRLRGGPQREAGADDGARELVGRRVGAQREVEVEVSAEELGELDAHDAALGQERAVLLDVKVKVLGETAVLDDDGFAQERAVLGAAYPEDVGQVEDVAEAEVVGDGRQGRAYAGAVHEEEEGPVLTQRLDGPQLGLGVDGADLGRVGDVHQPRLGHVRVVPVVGQRLGDALGRQLAVERADVDDLVAAGFDRARLARDDVARAGGDDGLVRTETGRYRDGIRRRPARHEEDVDVVAAQMPPHVPSGLGAVPVVAVARLLRPVAGDEGLEHLRMGAFAVVVEEALRHKLPSRPRHVFSHFAANLDQLEPRLSQDKGATRDLHNTDARVKQVKSQMVVEIAGQGFGQGMHWPSIVLPPGPSVVDRQKRPRSEEAIVTSKTLSPSSSSSSVASSASASSDDGGTNGTLKARVSTRSGPMLGTPATSNQSSITLTSVLVPTASLLTRQSNVVDSHSQMTVLSDCGIRSTRRRRLAAVGRTWDEQRSGDLDASHHVSDQRVAQPPCQSLESRRRQALTTDVERRDAVG